MKTITADPGLVAYCGLYCGACKKYLNDSCKGCQANASATWCKVRDCCIERRIRSCADCGQFKDPEECGKFNNIFSKLFGLVFHSDRRACIMQIRKIGCEGHAKDMAAKGAHTIKK